MRTNIFLFFYLSFFISQAFTQTTALDLVVDDIVTERMEYLPLDTLRYIVKVTVNGESSPAFTIGLELESECWTRDSNFLQKIAMPAIEVPAVDTGWYEFPFEYVLPANLLPCAFKIQPQVDAEYIITESNEYNNTYGSAYFDLVSPLEIIEVNCPDQFPIPGATWIHTITVQNQSANTSFPSKYYLTQQYLSGRSPAVDFYYGNTLIPALAPDEFYTFTLTSTMPHISNFPGNYGVWSGIGNFYLTNRAPSFDHRHYLYDIELFCKKTTTDLQVTLSTPDTIFGADRLVEYEVAITNNGMATAYNVSSVIARGGGGDGNVVSIVGDYDNNIITQGTGLFSDIWNIPTLAVGETVRVKVTYRVYQSTSYSPRSLRVEVGVSSGHLIDSLASNNRDTLLFYQESPDLTLQNLRIVNSNNAGQVIDYLVDVVNLGELTAEGDYLIDCYLSKDEHLQYNDVKVGEIPTGNTPVGAIANVPGAIRVPSDLLEGGPYFLILIIDANRQIAERREDNNTIIVPITVDATGTPATCLRSIIDISSIGAVFAGIPQTVTATIRNNTNQPLPSTNTRIIERFFSPSLQQSYSKWSTSTATIPALAPNEIKQFTFEITPLRQNYNSPYHQWITPTSGRPPIRPNDGVPQGKFWYITDNIYPVELATENCLTLANMTINIPSTDLSLQLLNNENCYGDDLVLQNTLELTNLGTQASSENIFVELGPLYRQNQEAEISHGYIFRFSQFSRAIWVIPPPFAPGQKATITNPIAIPDPNYNEQSLQSIYITPFLLRDNIRTNDTVHLQLNYDPNCGMVNQATDLELLLNVENPAAKIYESTLIKMQVKNTGTLTANHIQVDFPSFGINSVVSGNFSPTVTHGSTNISYNSTINDWSIPTLAPNETAELTAEIFYLTEPFIYAQISRMEGTDIDSTPNNGNRRTAEEDDEVVFYPQPIAPLSRPVYHRDIEIHQIYPTVATDVVQLDFTSKKESLSLTIYNVNGQQVLNKQLSDTKGFRSYFIDIQQLPAGSYYVLVGKGDRQQPVRFVKIRM